MDILLIILVIALLFGGPALPATRGYYRGGLGSPGGVLGVVLFVVLIVLVLRLLRIAI